MAGENDLGFLLSLADHMNFTQWVDENFHESTSEFDLTDMNLLDNFVNPEEHIDRLGSPSDVFEESEFADPNPDMASQPAKSEPRSETSELNDVVSLENNDPMAEEDVSAEDNVQDGNVPGSVSTLTPVAQSLRVDSVEPALTECKQENQPIQTQDQDEYQLRNQYHLPIHNQIYSQAQPEGQVQGQAPPYQPFTYPNPYIHGNYQQTNYHPQGVVPQSDQPQPQPQPQPQYHFPSMMPSFNPNPQPLRPTTRPPIDQPPKKYRAAPQPTPQNKQQAWLVPRLEHFTRQYQGYINSPNVARGIETVFLSLSHPPETATTTLPDTDMSFPRSTHEYRLRIRQMFEAICDWSSPREWRAKMGHSMAAQWIDRVKRDRHSRGLSTKMTDLTDEDLAPPPNLMPPVEEQWKNVIHRRLSDIEIELLCAKILNEAMLAQQGQNFIPLWSNSETQWEEWQLNKVLIHSALRASWISRITNSPFSETRRKDQNKAGNDRKRTLIEQVESRKRPGNEQSGGKQKKPRI
ncbi:hypothetical protein FLONG3_4319 [Fusarium longipes]|uniref:Uncharacterized protein n=1 Tax=Fusarium longipes TaxID=694270 RepID=A0A395SYG6_9HYPO|nr:hypothetical protein FLONG3_4319 [Fusarium longipes]